MPTTCIENLELAAKSLSISLIAMKLYERNV